MKKFKLTDIFKFAACLVICLLAGIIGSFFTRNSIPVWYEFLNKPNFTPPNQLFAPVWTILFVLMGISAFLVWQKGLHESRVRIALYIFGMQLILNVLWSAIFFGLKAPSTAFIEIIILWIVILLTILNFSRISVPATLLLIPYILWVSFAAILNFSIWRLNL